MLTIAGGVILGGIALLILIAYAEAILRVTLVLMLIVYLVGLLAVVWMVFGPSAALSCLVSGIGIVVACWIIFWIFESLRARRDRNIHDHASIARNLSRPVMGRRFLSIALPLAGLWLAGLIWYGALTGDHAPAKEHRGRYTLADLDTPTAPDTASRRPSPPTVSVSAANGALRANTEPITFEILAIAPVKVDITTDGTRRGPLSLTPGESLVVRAMSDMTLTLSDAGAVRLQINDRPTLALGSNGEERTIQFDRQNYASFLAVP